MLSLRDPFFLEELSQILKTRAGLPPLPKKLPQKRVRQDIKQGILRSVLVHFALVAVAVLSSHWSRWMMDPSEAARLKAQLQAQSAIRVDLVDLPSIKLSELENIDLSKPVVEASTRSEEKPADPPAPPSPEAMVDRSEKVDRQSREKKLKALRARLSGEAKRKELLSRLQSKKEKSSVDGRPALGGNIVSEGYALTGDVAKDVDIYTGRATTHLRQHFAVPAWMDSAKLSARVLVRLGPDGSVLSSEFTQRSGNEQFDEAVERALKLAQPFPAPPASLASVLKTEGVEWGFPR